MLRSTRRRAALCGITAAVLIGLATAGVPAPAAASPDAFQPQLVTVSTPDRANKQLLQTLGLDLTEHAGHDYVEVVLHTAAEAAALTGAGLDYDVRMPDLVAREAEINQLNATYAATTLRSPLPSGRDTYRTLDDYNADMAALGAAIRSAPDLEPSSQGIPLGDAFDEPALKALGDEMAAQNGYTSQHAWELYDTTGSPEDWSYSATGGSATPSTPEHDHDRRDERPLHLARPPLDPSGREGPAGGDDLR